MADTSICESPTKQQTDTDRAHYRLAPGAMTMREDTPGFAEPALGKVAGQFGASCGSEYSPSGSSSDRTRTPRTGSKTSKRKDEKPRWLSQVKEWFGTGEPSAQDFKQLRKQEFQKRGIAPDDPDAHAKMHAPIGQIPRHAIKTAGGPNPDKVAVKRAEERARKAYKTPPGTAGSASSRSSSSTKLRSNITPWE
jgi:hypothetical protein